MIIKLNPGQKVHLNVVAVETVEGNYGPQFKFSGTTPEDSSATLFLNIDPATRQMERIGLNAQSIVGQVVEVEKVEKNGQKFTNLNRVGPAVAAPTTSTAKQPFTSGPHIPGMDGPKPIATPEYGDEKAQQQAVDAIKANRLDALVTLYRTCFAEAVSIAKTVPATVPVTHEGISAMAATMYIAAKERAA